MEKKYKTSKKQLEYQHKYWEKNREELNRKRRKKYRKNREKELEYQHKYYVLHREERKAYRRELYRKQKELMDVRNSDDK